MTTEERIDELVTQVKKLRNRVLSLENRVAVFEPLKKSEKYGYDPVFGPRIDPDPEFPGFKITYGKSI